MFIFISMILISFVYAAPITGSAVGDNGMNSDDSNGNGVKQQNEITTSTQNQGETTQNQIKTAIKEQNRLRIYQNSSECPNNCSCDGSTTKCPLQDGKEMTIQAGNSGNKIIQVKGEQVKTQVELYQSQGKVYGQFKGNITKQINITPEQIRERIQERLKLQNCSCENASLNQEGYYEVQTKKRARLFFLFPVNEKVNAEVDVETGDVKVRNPWWGFLAKDIKEE